MSKHTTHNEVKHTFTNEWGTCMMVRVGDTFEVHAYAVVATEQGMRKQAVYAATGVEDEATAKSMYDDVVSGMQDDEE